MSDVSFTNITGPLQPDPYFSIVTKAVNLILGKFGSKARGNYELALKATKSDGIISEIYIEVAQKYGYTQLKSFKEDVKRRLKCFIAVDKNKNIVGWKKERWPCKMKGCPRCSPYRARIYLRYPDEIVMLGEINNREQSVSMVQEMNKVFDALDIGYFAATTIPTHDGRNIISIACLRFQETNPLTEDNEVKQALQLIEEEYSFLERVDLIDSSNTHEFVYLTHKSKIQISSTDLYLAMPAGQKANRERGRISGYYFDYDKMEVAYISKKDRQEKIDKEDGVVHKFNSPAARSDVPDNIKKKAIKKTIKRTSSHNERAAFTVEDAEDVEYHVNRFSSIYIEELENLGHPQPDVQVNVRLTQKNVDEFKSLVGIPKNGGFPSNILDINFEEIDLNRKTHGIRDQVNLIRQRLTKDTQDKLKNNITVEELLDRIVNQIEVKPPG